MSLISKIRLGLGFIPMVVVAYFVVIPIFFAMLMHKHGFKNMNNRMNEILNTEEFGEEMIKWGRKYPMFILGYLIPTQLYKRAAAM